MLTSNPQIDAFPVWPMLLQREFGYVYQYAVTHPETRADIVMAGQIVDRASWQALRDVGADSVSYYMLRCKA